MVLIFEIAGPFRWKPKSEKVGAIAVDMGVVFSGIHRCGV